MMEKDVISFPRCRECQSEDTVAQIMFGEAVKSGALPIGTFLSLAQQHTTLKAPDALGNVIYLTLHRDACASCGAERITRIEKHKMNPALLRRDSPQPLNRAMRRHLS